MGVVADRAVLVSLIVAVLLIALAVLSGRGRPSAGWIFALSVGLAIPFGNIALGKYGDNTITSYPGWMIGALAVSIAGVVAVVANARHDIEKRSTLTVVVAAIGIALFLSVPETGTLRLVPGPLVLIAIAVRANWLRPLAGHEIILIVAGLVWVGVTDGKTATTTMLGIILGLGLASIAPMVTVTTGDRRHRARQGAGLVLVTIAIVVGTRLVGTASSTAFAALLAFVTLSVAAGAAFWQRRDLLPT